MPQDVIPFEKNNKLGLVTHAASQCEGHFCCIHNPSNHHMKKWPMLWRGDRGMMERTCPHGIGHPDPDDVAFHLSKHPADKKWYDVHGCDGCCAPPVKLTPKQTADKLRKARQNTRVPTALEIEEQFEAARANPVQSEGFIIDLLKTMK